MSELRITVRSHSGHYRTFTDEKAAGVYSAELTSAGDDVLTTVLFPDGDLVEFAAIAVDLPEDVDLDRLIAVESKGGAPGANEVARALFPGLAPDQNAGRT